MASPGLTVNARFLTQRVTGVQRFAIEISRLLPAIVPCHFVTPAGARAEPGIAPRQVGLLRGHAWEQIDLPMHLGGRVLVSLGNTGPLAIRRQIVVVHDAIAFTMPETYRWRFRTWYQLLQRGLARRGVRIATVSAFARREIAHFLGLDPAEITIVGEGAEHILRPSPAPGLHARLGLHRPYVLAVGSLARQKNLAALSATAAMLAARDMDLVLTGDLNARVFRGNSAALPQPARLVGHMGDAELRALYEGAACFVFPSNYESFGLPAGEAMACGCPVVAAQVAALPETCGNAALYVDPTDQADIAAAVAHVLDDADCAARLRLLGRARAADLTWSAGARTLAGLAAELGATGQPA